MNFLNLEYFLTAANELNFTKAAKLLGISQQSLSTHIANLEKELDVSLFYRTTPLTLTYAGKAMVKRARQLLSLKDETVKEILDIKDFSTGELSIGISHTRGRTLLPEILPVYQKEFPNIELHILEGNSTELDRALVSGHVDLIIGMPPFVVDNIETLPLCSEEILMVVPHQVLESYYPTCHQEILKQLDTKADLRLLKDCPFLMTKKGNRIRNITDSVFEDLQFKPRIILETENIETLLALCIKGMGITFYPRMFASDAPLLKQYTGSRKLKVCSLDEKKTHGTLAIGYHKGRFLSRATKEFIRIAKEII